MHSGDTVHTFTTVNKTVLTDNSLSILGISPHELTKKEILVLSVIQSMTKKKKIIPNRAAREIKSTFF